MKNVKIKSIKLLNFKGIRTMEMQFNADSVTSIYGKNASGKSTIFDAFTWLMFGKNSEYKTKFSLKTLNADGEMIERLPHEVTAILDVDGEEIRLTKRLKEKWTKKKGSSAEEFTGNEEERLYNDIPMSVKEWSEKINNICSEDIFRMITNPLYFPSMKWQDQREALVRMAGDVSVDDVISMSPMEFGALIDSLNGKTLEEYKKEISAKKKRIKEEVDTIPSRIDERRRDLNNAYDFALLTARLNHKVVKADELSAQLKDLRSMMLAGSNIDAIADERGKIFIDISKRRTQIKERLENEYAFKFNEYIKLKTKLADAETTVAYNNTQIERINTELVNLKMRRAELLTIYKQLKTLTLQFDETNFICPTCGRQLEPEQVEQKQNEMLENFNRNKAKSIEQNIAEGKEIKKQIDTYEVRIAGFINDNELLNAEISRLKTEISDEPKRLSAEEIEDIVKNDEEIVKLNKRYEELGNTNISADNSLQAKVDALGDEYKAISEEIADLKTKLSIKEANEANEKRIKDLEKQLRESSNELARLEGIEFKIQEFTKTRISIIEERINSLFSFVKFKMFETQINGGEVETCKAMVNGVPFDDLNKAMKINAGLDIINAICKSLQVTAPIFVDNSESVNKLTETESQIIRLVVSEDEQLRIA